MIQLETKKLAFLLCGLVLLGLGLFVFGAFGERTSHAVMRPFVKIWRKASDSKDVAVEWVDEEAAAKDKKIRELFITINKSSYHPTQVKLLHGTKWTIFDITNLKKQNIPDSQFRFNAKDFPQAEVIDLR